MELEKHTRNLTPLAGVKQGSGWLSLSLGMGTLEGSLGTGTLHQTSLVCVLLAP